MQPASRFDSPRWELVNAILIAVVSFATALLVYMTNTAGSNASSSSHQGMIDAVKLDAFANESWRQVYQDASSAYTFAVARDGNEALKASQDPATQAQAKNFETYLLPSLQMFASPLTTEIKYQRQDGTYDLQARFDGLQDDPIIKAQDPQAQFQKAEQFYAQQRWYLTGSILLALSLFWLALAQISKARRKGWSMGFGVLFFLIGALWVIGYLVVQGGAA
jgi:hypothetical protein